MLVFIFPVLLARSVIYEHISVARYVRQSVSAGNFPQCQEKRQKYHNAAWKMSVRKTNCVFKQTGID